MTTWADPCREVLCRTTHITNTVSPPSVTFCDALNSSSVAWVPTPGLCQFPCRIKLTKAAKTVLCCSDGVYFLGKPADIQRLLTKARTSNTVTTVRHSQFAQPLSSALSHGNESYNMNSPSVSPVTVVRNYLQSCLCSAHTSRSYYSRAVFILVRPSDCAALLFEGGDYLRWCLFEEIQ